MKRFLFIVLLFAGCKDPSTDGSAENATPDPPPTPPTFAKGDQVLVKPHGGSVGIIVEIRGVWAPWSYEVMFQNRNMIQEEKNLVLHKKFDWAQNVPIEAEIKSDKEILVVP